MIFKTFKKKTDTGAMSVYNRISDLTRLLRDRVRPYKTVRERVTPSKTVYTTTHEVQLTNELNRVNIIYKLYGIELQQKLVGPYVNPVNVKLIV